MTWGWVLVTLLACLTTKLTGPLMPHRLLNNERTTLTTVGMTAGMLVGLVGTSAFTMGSVAIVDVRLASLLVAVMTLWLRTPFLLAMVLDVVAAALVRVAGVAGWNKDSPTQSRWPGSLNAPGGYGHDSSILIGCCATNLARDLMDRLIVYADGSNLYYGLHEAAQCCWLRLDLVALAEKLRLRSQLVVVHYFTAPVCGQWDIPARQQTYYQALETKYPQQVRIIESRYQRKPR